jgi:YVTN family beta-propeller protein
MGSQGRRAGLGVVASLIAVASLAFAGEASAASARNVYVANAANVAYFPSPAQTPVNTISGITNPSRVVVTPDGATAYVLGTDGNVTPVNTSTNTAGPAIFAATGASDIAISPDGNKVFVGNGSFNTIKVISTTSNTVTDTFTGDSMSDTPDRLAVSPDGTKLYIANRGVSPYLTIRNSTTGAQIGSDIPIGAGTPFLVFPSAVAVAPNGQTVYVANGEGTVSAVDLTATPNPTVHNISGLGSSPSALDVTPDGSEIYVANNASSNVSVISTSSETVVGSPIAVGLNPTGVAISPNGGTAYVSNSNASLPGDPLIISVINTATKAASPTPVPVGTFPGPSPQGLAIVPDQGPTADFSSTPAQAGTATGFDASASTDPEGTVAEYAWDFGDGNTATTALPTTSHTYAAGGAYDVTLTVTDNEGCANLLLFSGHTASCNPNTLAAKTSQVTIAAAPTPTPTPTPAPTAQTGPTGQQAAALKKCKKKKSAKAKKKCKAAAKKLPV